MRETIEKDGLILRDRGDPVEKFGAGDMPMPAQTTMTEEQAVSFFKRKRYVPVVVEIRTEGPIEMSRLEDRFTMWVDSTKLDDNTKILKDRMAFFSEHIRELVLKWTTELKG